MYEYICACVYTHYVGDRSLFKGSQSAAEITDVCRKNARELYSQSTQNVSETTLKLVFKDFVGPLLTS